MDVNMLLILGPQEAFLASEYRRAGDKNYEEGNFGKAIAFYDLALEVDVDSPEIWNSRGLSLCCLGRNSDAIDSFDKALELDQGYIDAWNNKGVVLYKTTHYFEAILIRSSSCCRHMPKPGIIKA
jgi:tetratricopeptide (TPR) repeat protein